MKTCCSHVAGACYYLFSSHKLIALFVFSTFFCKLGETSSSEYEQLIKILINYVIFTKHIHAQRVCTEGRYITQN